MSHREGFNLICKEDQWYGFHLDDFVSFEANHFSTYNVHILFKYNVDVDRSALKFPFP